MPNDTRPKTGQEALALLKEGNARYVDSLTSTDPCTQKRPELISDQDPLAIILGCSDARVPVEIVFDQGLGDLFVKLNRTNLRWRNHIARHAYDKQIAQTLVKHNLNRDAGVRATQNNR